MLHKKISQLAYLLLVFISLAACNPSPATSQQVPKSLNPTKLQIESQIVVKPIVSSTPISVIQNESNQVGIPESAHHESITELSNQTIESSEQAIFPTHRIIAYYGNPLSKKMGALGEYAPKTMINKLNKEVSIWNKADPETPAIPALHLIATVAQNDPGTANKYRMIMPDDVINNVYELAKQNDALFFIDLQTGHDDIRKLLPRFEWILKNPDVHLGIDPEFNLISSKAKPGTRVGTYDASDINYVTNYLQQLTTKYNLPPKILVIHRFTKRGVTNAKKIILRPDVQIVMNMDGWGAPELKRGTYRNYIVPEPVQYTGFKVFYHNDTKAGDRLMTPSDILKLDPQPLYIQYQ